MKMFKKKEEEITKQGDAGINEEKSWMKPRKRMPVWKMVVLDITMTGICLCVFALFHHVLPQRLPTEQKVVASVDDSGNKDFTLPGTEGEGTGQESSKTGSETGNDASSNEENSSRVGSSEGNDDNSMGRKKTGGRPGGPGGSGGHSGGSGFSNENTTDISSDTSASSIISSDNKTVTKLNQTSNDKMQVTVNKVEIGSGNDKITYYVSDIYVTNVKYLKTAFAGGEYSKNQRAETGQMAKDNNAVAAISGDSYGFTEEGIVIRNGVLYRSEASGTDICVLFTDGTMKTYSPDQFDADKVIAHGAWQAWSFGPGLLDESGNILSSFNTTSYINGANPRCAIGCVKEGHYVFVTVDGRNPGYSKGVTLSELAQIMKDLGCTCAYNLDGGKSAAMVYEDAYVNQPTDGGRTISDIIYIGE